MVNKKTEIECVVEGEKMMDMVSEMTTVSPLQAIEFEDLRTSEELIIETQNSSYRFSIIDVHQRRGFLSGGSLGDKKTKAILMGAICKKGDAYVTDPWGLKTDARAFFYLETESGMKHLVTSLITRLTHVRNGEEQKYLF
ncbi:MAG: hypothetical protein AB1757_27060 [Acidobacteriota bacterium]